MFVLPLTNIRDIVYYLILILLCISNDIDSLIAHMSPSLLLEAFLVTRVEHFIVDALGFRCQVVCLLPLPLEVVRLLEVHSYLTAIFIYLIEPD